VQPRFRDRAKTVFDCRMANDPAMMSSTKCLSTSNKRLGPAHENLALYRLGLLANSQPASVAALHWQLIAGRLRRWRYARDDFRRVYCALALPFPLALRFDGRDSFLNLTYLQDYPLKCCPADLAFDARKHQSPCAPSWQTPHHVKHPLDVLRIFRLGTLFTLTNFQ
jgi:hypothetical protein